jgi:phage shock protein PspC (stress-responsive transcriptional regulator)
MNTNQNKTSGDSHRELRRSTQNRKIAGVASGFANYFNTDVTLVRIGFVALSFVSGIGIAIYLAAWALIADVGSDNSIAGDVVLRGWCH